MTPGYRLCLTRDELDTAARPLPAITRVLYVLHGRVAIDVGSPPLELGADAAWHGAGACRLTPAAPGATILRYELVKAGTSPVRGSGSTRLLEHDVRLDPAAAYLMRCDRVDFDLGGEALPHRHRGGGIRCLLAGRLELRVEGERDRSIAPGQAWFESGREAVYAKASATEATSFIRCSILPAEIRGKSSIVYVDPAHAASKPRRYTVLVDEPIRLP